MPKTSADGGLEMEDRAESLAEWLRVHARQVTIGVVAVVAVGAMAWLWRAAAVKKEQNGSRALAQAQQIFGSGNLPLAQSDLQRLIQRYSGTNAAVQGRLLLAQVLFNQNKVDSGLLVLRQGEATGAFASAYHSIMAAGLEQSGKPLEAAEAYLRAAEGAQATAERASFQADAARAYRAAGRTEDARRIWAAIAEDVTNPMAGEAKIRLGELTAKPAAKG
jgi:predicted negative regulator of RcsB-dependent stress response